MTEKNHPIDEILEKKELIHLKTAQVEYRLKLQTLKEAKNELIASDVKLRIEQLCTLKNMMGMTMIDSDRTIFANEPHWVSSFTEEELAVFKKKIMNLVAKF